MVVVHALREEYYMCACCTIDMNSRGSVTKVWGCDWVRNQQASQQQQGQQRDNKWYPPVTQLVSRIDVWSNSKHFCRLTLRK